MGILGSYLVLKLNDAVVAETTSVSLKMISKGLETTSQSSGVYSSYEGGKVKIGMAGKFLLASGSANWTILYDFMKAGDEFEVELFVNESSLFSGFGLMKKLSLRGADESSLVTGAYGIRYQIEPSYYAITTEGDLIITTEDGQDIIIE